MRLCSSFQDLGLLFLLTICAASAPAQVDLSAWPQVKLQLLAVNQAGEPVPILNSAHLNIREAGKPRPVVDLTPTSEPQSVCILLDASDSVGDGLAMVTAKAKRLLRNLAPEDEVCVASFADGLQIQQDLTADRAAAEAALARVQRANGTRLRDAVVDLAAHMRTSAANRSRAILLISDGMDVKSDVKVDAMRKALEAEGSPVISMICLPQAFGHARRKQSDPREGTAFKLTDVGGGMTYFPHTMADMNGLVMGLPQALRTRYILTYETARPARDGHEVLLSVSLDRGPGGDARILAPEGYYAPAN